jgi:polynucleotide 5'-triphosphatase
MDPDSFRQYRFEANMPLEQHRHFNNILNETVKRTQARDYKVNVAWQLFDLV